MNSLTKESQSAVSQLKGPILIIGASGFVGANLFNYINNVRSDVIASIRTEKGWRLESVSEDQVCKIDINDAASIESAMNHIKPKTIYNCSAFGAYSFEDQQHKIYQTNLDGTIKLINVLRNHNIHSFIHAGSSSEYGLNSHAPTEEMACMPDSDYSISKLAASNYINLVGKKNGFPGISLRLYSVYGPLEDSSRLIPTLIKKGLKKSYPRFVNKNISRDFIYVQDVCNAFVMAALNINPSIYGEIFNIGSGEKTTIENLAYVAKNTFDIIEDPQFGSLENRKWDLSNWFSNPSKAKDILGWEAKTSIQTGLNKTVEWTKDFPISQKTITSKKITAKNNKSISAIIACYKDESAIPIMYEELSLVFKKIKVDYEIIFVNDCSPDNSRNVIQEISKNDHKVLGVNHSRNFGSQIAFISGMVIASKDAVVLLDGDLQDPPFLIEKFYEKWIEGNDVVYGRRVKREMGRITEFQYKMFYRILSKYSYLDIPRDAGDFSLLDKKVVKLILSFPEKDIFLRGVRAYIGLKQTGVDYIRPERRFGKSTNNFMKNIDWAKRGIFSFSNSPLALLSTGGMLLLLISIMMILTFIALRVLFPDQAPEGATSILVSIFTFGALNILAIGIVGEYIGKILIEVKQRPRLIRESIIKNGEEDHLNDIL
jgi:polyisoprenyl-phosphate glycosyltransferase